MPMLSLLLKRKKFSNFLLDAGWERMAIGIFSPLGEPISLHQLCCSPFAVCKYNFMGHFLADAAILARE
jgi:hypothetical protein